MAWVGRWLLSATFGHWPMGHASRHSQGHCTVYSWVLCLKRAWGSRKGVVMDLKDGRTAGNCSFAPPLPTFGGREARFPLLHPARRFAFLGFAQSRSPACCS